MDIDKEIASLKKVIETAVKDKARLEGSIEANLAALKEQFGFTTVVEAESAIIKMEEEAAVTRERIQTQLTKIKEELENGNSNPTS